MAYLARVFAGAAEEASLGHGERRDVGQCQRYDREPHLKWSWIATEQCFFCEFQDSIPMFTHGAN